MPENSDGKVEPFIEKARKNVMCIEWDYQHYEACGNQIMFCCQQAAELMVKQAIRDSDGEPKKIHDIAKLLHDLDKLHPIPLDNTIIQCAKYLTSSEATIRYDCYTWAEKDDVDDMIRYCNEIAVFLADNGFASYSIDVAGRNTLKQFTSELLLEKGAAGYPCRFPLPEESRLWGDPEHPVIGAQMINGCQASVLRLEGRWHLRVTDRFGEKGMERLAVDDSDMYTQLREFALGYGLIVDDGMDDKETSRFAQEWNRKFADYLDAGARPPAVPLDAITNRQERAR